MKFGSAVLLKYEIEYFNCYTLMKKIFYGEEEITI